MNPSENKDLPPGEMNEVEMTMDQAIELAIDLQRQSRLEQAESLYRQILEAYPLHPDVLHFYGVLQHQRGFNEEACRLISQALTIVPDYLDAHNNLGNILRESDRLDEAEACYRKVINLDSTNAGAYNNLGSVLRAKGEFEPAQAAYTQAMTLAPDFAMPHLNMGHLLAQKGRLAEALTYYAQSMVLDPQYNRAKRSLGVALYCLGRLGEAAEVFRQWTIDEPDNPEARHLHAACSGEEVPTRAPDIYIKHVFDKFSVTFEERLAELEYRAPGLVGTATSQACDKPTSDLIVLDAGCGTGLCASFLRPYAASLVGVDLSTGMLERAKATGKYDALHEAELTDFLANHPGCFDLIASADTLCYFGALDRLLSVAAQALRRGGHFIFTLEEDVQPTGREINGYRIQPNGRYCHHEDYVRQIVAQAGFDLKTLDHADLRMEFARQVAGMVVTLKTR